jgi:hypothetical protein
LSASGNPQRLESLVARLRARFGPPLDPPEALPPDGQRIHELVRSFFVWEAGERRAQAALDAVAASLVDFNELRVCLPAELAAILGERFPLALERSRRLRATLNSLFRREHAVTLDAAAGLSKRDARAYLAGLEGMPAFVADRLTLVLFGGHAFPVDARLVRLLTAEKVFEDGVAPDAASSWIEHHLHAGEAYAAYRLVEQWADEASDAAPEPVRAATRRQRTRKKSEES